MKLKNLISVTVILLFAACTKEPNINIEHDVDQLINASFSVPVFRTLDPGDLVSEYNIETLRILVTRANTPGFSDDVIVVNELKQVDINATTVDFRITVPVGNLNVYFIANETDEMDLIDITSISRLKDIVVDYSTTMDDNGVKSPFTMFSDYKSVRVDKNGNITYGVSSKTLFEVERSVAKLTVKINCDYNDLGGTQITPAGVEIVTAPYYQYLTPREYIVNSPDDDFTNIGPVVMTANDWESISGTNSKGGFQTKTGKEVVIYLPEHIVNRNDLSNYTYLKLEVRKTDNTPEFYEIPLGNGLGTKFHPADFKNGVPSAISSDDLSITRNIWYDLTLNIKSLDGNVHNIGAHLIPMPWKEVPVDGTMNAPYLNVSTVSATVGELTSTRVYFWSNQPNVLLEADGNKETSTGDQFVVNSIFDRIADAGASNFSYTYNEATKSGTGWFDIKIAASEIASPTKFIVYLKSGRLRREIAINTPAIKSPTLWSNNRWVGTFHRASEVGERIIYSDHSGDWSARVEDPSSTGSFVVLGDKSGIRDHYLRTNTPGNPEGYPVLGSATTVNGTGKILFRVGMKSKYNPTSAAPARYARIVVTHSGGTSYVYVRQGEDADYIYGNGANPKWSVYNVNTTGSFTDYPSKAGYLKPFSSLSKMYAPVGNDDSSESDPRTSIAKVCPTGYKIPNADGSLTFSASNELRSLLEVSNERGYYADGYFDRRAIEKSTSDVQASAVNASSNHIAYVGTLFFNSSTNASLFFPAAGCRLGGGTYDTGDHGNYWSNNTTLPLEIEGIIYNASSHLFFGMGYTTSITGFKRETGFSIRCIIE